MKRFLQCIQILLLLVWLPVTGGESKETPPQSTQKESEHVELKITITGIKDELLTNAEAHLELRQKMDDPHFTESWLKRLHKLAPEDIRESLQPFGYYNVSVESSLTGENEKWIATYAVAPGPQTTIGVMDVKWSGEGAEEPSLQKALAEFPLKQGDPFVHKTYESAKLALMDQAGKLGYVDVTATKAKVLVKLRDNSAEIKLHLDTGGRYYLGKIRVHQDILNPDFVARYLVDIKPGDAYSQDGLLEVQRDLISAGYFSLVDVIPAFKEADQNHVPVDIKLSPANRQVYSFGLGYDTDIGPNVTVRWQHRRLNKRGHRADAMFKYADKEKVLRGSYWIPVRDPRTHELGFTAKLEKEKTDSTERKTMDLEAGYFYVWSDWDSKAFVEFKHENFIAGTENEEITNLLSLGMRVERIKFPDAAFPRRGWGLYSELRGSPGGISDISYLRYHLKSRALLPIGEKGRFALRGELGVAGVSDFEKYPTSLRFFAGGDQSVRGYEWKSLGPKDDSGEVVGGKNLFTASLEYDHRVLESWAAAAFVDAGNAYNNELDKLYYGAGVGVRWLSPVGSVRFDLAWPMNPDDDDTGLSSVRVHFGFEVML
ncbi:MAG: outer membrane protein assembly factor [Gammaproteobacteria bacterium]|nr:outer membrane protein assembly factor [Gammaproteobacteria bacterium]